MKDDLIARLTEWLLLGGNFNPELMNSDKTRELILECRDALEATSLRPQHRTPFSEDEIQAVLTSLYQDGMLDLVLADRVALLMGDPPDDEDHRS